MSTPDFRQLERQLADSRSLTDLAEAHGTLSGALCSGDTFTLQDWLREVFPEGVAGAAEAPMHAVFEWTQHALRSGQLEFHLLLPGDDEAMAIRVTALGQWCQGFLYGLGANPIPDVDQLPEEIGEIVRDISAMTQIEVDEGDSPEENEQAYAELVEFVRVGVQLLHEELARFRTRQAAATTGRGGLSAEDEDERPPQDDHGNPVSIH